MSETRVADGDELPPEAANFSTTPPEEVPEDEGNSNADLKEDTDG